MELYFYDVRWFLISKIVFITLLNVPYDDYLMSNKRVEDRDKSIFSVIIILSTPIISSLTSCALEAERVAATSPTPTYDGGEVCWAPV